MAMVRLRMPALCAVLVLATLYGSTEGVPLPPEGGVVLLDAGAAEGESYAAFSPNFVDPLAMDTAGMRNAQTVLEAKQAVQVASQRQDEAQRRVVAAAKALADAGGNTSPVEVGENVAVRNAEEMQVEQAQAAKAALSTAKQRLAKAQQVKKATAAPAQKFVPTSISPNHPIPKDAPGPVKNVQVWDKMSAFVPKATIEGGKRNRYTAKVMQQVTKPLEARTKLIRKIGALKSVDAHKQAQAASVKEEISGQKTQVSLIGDRAKKVAFMNSRDASAAAERDVRKLNMDQLIKQTEKNDALEYEDSLKAEAGETLTDSKAAEKDSQEYLARKAATEGDKLAEKAVVKDLATSVADSAGEHRVVGVMRAQARAEKLGNIHHLHGMKVSATEEKIHRDAMQAEQESAGLQAIARTEQLSAPRKAFKPSPLSMIPRGELSLLEIPDGVVPDDKAAGQQNQQQQAPAQQNQQQAPAQQNQQQAPAQQNQHQAPAQQNQHQAPAQQNQQQAPAQQNQQQAPAQQNQQQAPAQQQEPVQESTSAKEQAKETPAEVQAERAAQASAQEAEHQKAEDVKRQVAIMQKGQAQAAKIEAKAKYAPKGQDTAKGKVEDAAEKAARKSADAATLVAEQQQKKRDVRFLPKLVAKMQKMQSELKQIRTREKYGADVATAIAKGIAQVRDGKTMQSSQPQEEVDIELGETEQAMPHNAGYKQPYFPAQSFDNNPRHATQSDIRSGMEAGAYRQAVEWENGRQQSFEKQQQSIQDAKMSTQEKQAASLALQRERTQDQDRRALMNEIGKVHDTYAHDLEQAQEMAKAKAMKALKYFAKKMKAGGEQGLGLNYATAAVHQMRKKMNRSVKKALGESATHAPAAQNAAPTSAPASAPAPAPAPAAPAKKETADVEGLHKLATAQPHKVDAGRKISRKQREARTIRREQAKAQEQAIMQAGVERALVDTAKKIKDMKAQIHKEVHREKAYFTGKEAKAIKKLDQDSVVTEKIDKLKKMDDQAQQNLAHEEHRLERRVDSEQKTEKEMEKVSLAAHEEVEGLKKTRRLAKEMKHTAHAVKGMIREQLRYRMKPHDRVDRMTDLGEVVHVSGQEDLGESDELLSSDARKIEKQQEKNIKEDLDNVKILEKTAGAAAQLFADAAKTSMKENTAGMEKERKIAFEAKEVVKRLKMDVAEGLSMEAKSPEVTVTSAKKAKKGRQPVTALEDDGLPPVQSGYDTAKDAAPAEGGTKDAQAAAPAPAPAQDAQAAAPAPAPSQDAPAQDAPAQDAQAAAPAPAPAQDTQAATPAQDAQAAAPAQDAQAAAPAQDAQAAAPAQDAQAAAPAQDAQAAAPAQDAQAAAPAQDAQAAAPAQDTQAAAPAQDAQAAAPAQDAQAAAPAQDGQAAAAQAPQGNSEYYYDQGESGDEGEDEGGDDDDDDQYIDQLGESDAPELFEEDESGDLGESDEDYSPHARKGGKGGKGATLKAEQFALVNAQTKLNQVTRNRKRVENRLEHRLRMKMKTDVEEERLNLKADEQKYQKDANQALQATTKIDKYLAGDFHIAAKNKKEMVEMKQLGDRTVHDEFIAASTEKKMDQNFKQFLGQAAGLESGLHNPNLVKAMDPNHGAPAPAAKGGNKQQGSDLSKIHVYPAIPKPNGKTAEQKQVRDIDHYVDKPEPMPPGQRLGQTGPKVDDTQVQPNKKMAVLAMQQEKRDEMRAAAYGTHLEQLQEQKVGRGIADMKGNGSIRGPQLTAENVINNPETWAAP